VIIGVENRCQIKLAQSRDLATIGCKEQIVINLKHHCLWIWWWADWDAGSMAYCCPRRPGV